MNIKRYDIFPVSHQTGNEIESVGGRYVRFSDVDSMQQRLTAAEQRNAELEADKARIDFWQENPKYAGGFAPSGEWSFFSREYGTCYGKDLRSAFDRLQVMHKDLAQPTESGASE